METNVARKSDWLLTVEGKVEPEEVRTERKKLLKRFARRVKLPGFRPGKAPASMIDARYADEIKAELAEEFASRAYREVLEDESIRPLSQARLSYWNFIEDDELRFEVEAEVMPSIQVRGYHNLKLKQVTPPSSQELTQKRLENLRERSARFEPVQRPAREGDYVRCDYSVYRGEKKQDKQTGVTVKVGDRENFPEINAALAGKKAGEIAEAEVRYPDDAGEQAGQKALFKFYISAVKERRLPEVDEEFAKEMGFKNLEEMENKLGEQAEEEAEYYMREKREDQIFSQLLELNQFEPPPSLVEERTRYLLGRLRVPDTPETREKVEPKAREHVKLDIILEQIAQKEDIQVSDEELEEWFEARSQRLGIPVIQAKQIFKRELALSEARRRKTLDYLLEQASKGGLVVHPDSD